MRRRLIREFARSWWPAFIGWGSATAAIATAIWQTLEGDVDLLWITALSLGISVVCWILAFQHSNILGRDTFDRASALALPSHTVDDIMKETRSIRQWAAVGPAVVTTVVCLILIVAGNRSLLEPARCVPTDMEYYSFVGGVVDIIRGTHIEVLHGIISKKRLDRFTPEELGNVALRSFGVKFRIERSPNVYKCEVTKISVTVLRIDDLIPLEPPKGAAEGVQPVLTWVAELPDHVAVGQTIQAKLVNRDERTGAGTESHDLPNLPPKASQPFVVRFVSRTPALYKVRIMVHVDSGWRSWICGPINIGEVALPFYDPKDIVAADGTQSMNGPPELEGGSLEAPAPPPQEMSPPEAAAPSAQMVPPNDHRTVAQGV